MMMRLPSLRRGGGGSHRDNVLCALLVAAVFVLALLYCTPVSAEDPVSNREKNSGSLNPTEQPHRNISGQNNKHLSGVENINNVHQYSSDESERKGTHTNAKVVVASASNKHASFDTNIKKAQKEVKASISTTESTSTTSVPASTSTTSVPASTSTTSVPASTSTTSVPASTSTTSVPASTSTTSAPASTSTTSVPASTSTTSVPASTSTTSVPASTSTTSVPASTSTTSVPASTSTTSVPASTSTTSVPASTSTTSAPASTSTTSAPASTSTTSVPASTSTTSVPASTSTTSVPASTSTTSVPASTSTTSAPASNSGKGTLLFFFIFVIVILTLVSYSAGLFPRMCPGFRRGAWGGNSHQNPHASMEHNRQRYTRLENHATDRDVQNCHGIKAGSPMGNCESLGVFVEMSHQQCNEVRRPGAPLGASATGHAVVFVDNSFTTAKEHIDNSDLSTDPVAVGVSKPTKNSLKNMRKVPRGHAPAAPAPTSFFATAKPTFGSNTGSPLGCSTKDRSQREGVEVTEPSTSITPLQKDDWEWEDTEK